MRFNFPATVLALGALLLQGCAVQAPAPPVAAPAAPSSECSTDFELHLEVVERHRKLMQALNAGQVEQALAFYAPKALVVAPSSESVAYNSPAWVRLYLQEHLVAKGARFDTDDLFQFGASYCDVEVLGGNYLLTLNGEKLPRPYLIVWRRIHSDWFVIAHHVDLASRVPQPTRTSMTR